MDIEIITSMFEDIKKLNSDQFNKICELIKENQVKLPLPTIQKVDSTIFDKFKNGIDSSIKSELQNHYQHINEILKQIREQKQEALPPQKHIHSFQINSSKTIIWFTVLVSLLLCSIVSNISQYSDIKQMSDNDIKYRYIKSVGKATPGNILQLETIFEYEPDKQKQKTLRQRVEQHERTVAERAKALEEARIKAAQAEQLRQEAEKIKQNK